MTRTGGGSVCALHIPGLAAKVFLLKAFMALIDELITEQKMTRDPTQPPRHLTDAFLDEVKEARWIRRQICVEGPEANWLCVTQGSDTWADRSRVEGHGTSPLSLSLPSWCDPGQGEPESSFNDENLRMVVVDLFSAGMVTTSTKARPGPSSYRSGTQTCSVSPAWGGC